MPYQDGMDAAFASALRADRAKALELTPVSRETAERLDSFVLLLLEWQQKMNLVASSTLPLLWTRHIADSLQLLDLAPSARIWIDIGSGAGFPGMVLACALASVPGARVHLVESNKKKAEFLQAAKRVCGSPAVVHPQRAEEFTAMFTGPADVLCARAVAPLNQLLTLMSPLLAKTRAMALLPKGQNVERELREASNWWQMHATMILSRTDPTGRIVVLRGLSPRAVES